MAVGIYIKEYLRSLRQKARLVAFGPHGGAEVDDQAKHLLPQQNPIRGAVLWEGLPTWTPPGTHRQEETH